MSEFTKEWITQNSITILEDYEGAITVRQLYYRLVSVYGMTNDTKHYKKVVNAMISARWNGDVEFEAFIDRERSMFGETKAEPKDLLDSIAKGQEQVELWMRAHYLNRWSNQPEYIEVWIEKKALQGVFERPCSAASVGLAPCKGYPSLTFVNEAKDRFDEAIERGQTPIILYFGDYDPSGEDIPRSIEDNLYRMGCEVEVERIALNPQQISDLYLPSAPAKLTDTRTRNWSGDGVVELDAVEPRVLGLMATKAIEEHFDKDLYSELMNQEKVEREEYKKALKTFVKEL